MKQCHKCKKWKDESKFGKNLRLKDGLRSWCRDCDRDYAQKRYKKPGQTSKRYYRYEERHRVVKGVKEKRCSKCRKWKPETEFFRKRSHKDGLDVWCKECSNKAVYKAHKRRLPVRN